MTSQRALFWRGVPRSSRVIFLAGGFVTFSIFGWLSDVFAFGRATVPHLIVMLLLSGGFAILWAWVAMFYRERWHYWIGVFLAQFSGFLIASWFFGYPPRARSMDWEQLMEVQRRLNIAGAGIAISVVVSYILFLRFIRTEGARFFRAQTEISLASEIHKQLAPKIDGRAGSFVFYGESIASGEVGGDLVDVVSAGDKWVAYVADVSGHGVAPGVVMGMVKSAVRMRLTGPDGDCSRSAGLLTQLNEVLFPLKKSNMFVTFGYIASDGERLEYALAGHPQILHYRAATRDFAELPCDNLPVGILSGVPFSAKTAPHSDGDLFVLLTDGLLEAANSKGEEFGIEGIKRIVAENVSCPLPDIYAAVVKSVQQHGARTDDQSMLLVRC